MNLFYAGSKKGTLVESEEFSFMEEQETHPAPVKFRDKTGAPWTLPIGITISSNPSRFMAGAFDPKNISVNITDEKTYTISTAKDKATRASLIELLRSSDDYQDVRTLLDRLASGKPYTEPDLSIRCAALYGAFSNFLSRVDARALFWAFVKRNEGLIDPQIALGGGRREELAAVGFGN